MKEFKTITSRENSLIKLTSLLQSSANARKENKLFVLEGLRICKDAFENGIWFDKLIISDSAYSKFQNEIALFSENSTECFKIPDSLFKKISDTTSPQGIIALAKMPDMSTTKIDIKGRYIALENIQDPSNLGAVSRTAEALGVTGIILSRGGCDPFSPKSLRASMGTLLRMPIFIFDDFANSISTLGLKTFGCVVDRETEKINDITMENGVIFIIGNEANGLTYETKNRLDRLVTIPMKGRAESLNAAVAASIVMWEMMK